MYQVSYCCIMFRCSAAIKGLTSHSTHNRPISATRLSRDLRQPNSTNQEKYWKETQNTHNLTGVYYFLIITAGHYVYILSVQLSRCPSVCPGIWENLKFDGGSHYHQQIKWLHFGRVTGAGEQKATKNSNRLQPVLRRCQTGAVA